MQTLAVPHDCKCVGADAIHRGFYNREGNCSRNGSVNGVAPGEKHAQSGLGC